jgi:hypothetical protein
MRVIFLACVVSTLVGCATEQTVLVNSRGEELTCETEGWGFVGSLATPHKQKECIADAEKRGYRLK